MAVAIRTRKIVKTLVNSSWEKNEKENNFELQCTVTIFIVKNIANCCTPFVTCTLP